MNNIEYMPVLISGSIASFLFVFGLGLGFWIESRVEQEPTVTDTQQVNPIRFTSLWKLYDKCILGSMIFIGLSALMFLMTFLV